MTATVFSAAVTNVAADENDEEEKTFVSLNPCVATNGNIHIVWQENMGNFEIFYANDAGNHYENTLRKTIEDLNNLDDKDSQKALKNMEKALEQCLEGDWKYSIDTVHKAIKFLEKTENKELINTLVDATRDFAKTNILYAEYNLGFENSYIQEAWEKYYFVAIEKYKEENYDATVKQFKNAYLKIVEAYEENDETYVGVDFGKIVRISYTDYDSVAPQIFLNGTISVGWKEIMDSESHVYYARSSNNGKTWWYFDATEYGYNYLCAIGINPYSVGIETTLCVTRALEDIRAVYGCHYIYTPIVRKETGIIDKHYYSPINDPYFELYKYEIVPIDGREFYLICGGPHPLPPPKMPDLTFRYAYPSKPLPVEGEKITVYANITNQGDATVSGEVSSTFLQKDVMVGNVSVSPPLKPGEGKQIEKEYTVTAGRHVMIQSIADPNNDLTDEGNKDNNIISFSMNIVKEVKTDWGVTDAKRLDDTDIHLTGNMTVQTGAKLELNDTFLLVNSTTPGQYTINIANGGKVEINNTIIQSENSSVGYKFIVNGEMNLTRSAIGDMWGDETGMGGVEIYSNASVTDSAIHDGKGSGLYVKDSSPRIANTTILYNKVYDIYLDTNANPTLLNCVFNESKVYFKDTTSKLNIERYMHVRVVDSSNQPVMFANVTVKDNNGAIVYTGLTDHSGYARWIPIPYRSVTKTTDAYLSHTVTACKDGVSDLKILEGWEDDLSLSISGSSMTSGKPPVLTVDRNKNTYWEGKSGQSSYSLTLDTENSIEQGNMSIYYPEGCTDKYNMTVHVHSHSGIRTTGHGLSFDGNDYVGIPESDSIDLSGGNFTQEIWIYPTITDDNFHGFLGRDGNDPHRYPGLWIYQKTRIHGGFGDGTNWNSFTTGNAITENAWNHVATTFDGTWYKVYVNGAEVYSTDSFAGRKPYPTKAVNIGYINNYFNGIIDEVRILNRAMSSNEIMQDYTDQIYAPTDGVVGWWHFDKNINNTVYDASSNYNNGTIYGATWIRGISPLFPEKPCSALSFDGVDDYVAATCPLPPDSLTIEFWMKPTTVTGFDHPIGLGGDHMGTVYLYDGNGLISYKFYNLGGTKIEGAFGSYTLNQWQHIVVTYNGAEVRGYLNGELGGSTPASGSINYQNSDVIIGADVGGCKSFNGIIDEVRILNRAMSLDEIKQDYTDQIYSRVDNTVGWWHFNDGAGNTVRDASANGNNGGIHGAIWSSGIAPLGGVREIHVVKSSTDTMTNVLLSPNPDRIDKLEIIFNTWSNTPKISEITGVGDTVSPELAKTIARERVKLIEKEENWTDTTLSDPVLYFSPDGEPALYEVGIFSQDNTILGSIHVSFRKKESPCTYSHSKPWFMTDDNRTIAGYEKFSRYHEQQDIVPVEEERRLIWEHLAQELLFEGRWGSSTYYLLLSNTWSMDCIEQGDMYCTPTSGAMLLRYWGKFKGYSNIRWIDQDTVAAAMGSSHTSGTDPRNAGSGLTKVCWDYNVWSDAWNYLGLFSYNAYMNQINNDKPTLEHFRTWYGSWGHTVVGVGYVYDASQKCTCWCWYKYWVKYNYRIGAMDPEYSPSPYSQYHVYSWSDKRGGWWLVQHTTFVAYSQW